MPPQRHCRPAARAQGPQERPEQAARLEPVAGRRAVYGRGAQQAEPCARQGRAAERQGDQAAGACRGRRPPAHEAPQLGARLDALLLQARAPGGRLRAQEPVGRRCLRPAAGKLPAHPQGRRTEQRLLDKHRVAGIGVRVAVAADQQRAVRTRDGQPREAHAAARLARHLGPRHHPAVRRARSAWLSERQVVQRVRAAGPRGIRASLAHEPGGHDGRTAAAPAHRAGAAVVPRALDR